MWIEKLKVKQVPQRSDRRHRYHWVPCVLCMLTHTHKHAFTPMTTCWTHSSPNSVNDKVVSGWVADSLRLTSALNVQQDGNGAGLYECSSFSVTKQADSTFLQWVCMWKEINTTPFTESFMAWNRVMAWIQHGDVLHSLKWGFWSHR